MAGGKNSSSGRFRALDSNTRLQAWARRGHLFLESLHFILTPNTWEERVWSPFTEPPREDFCLRVHSAGVSKEMQSLRPPPAPISLYPELKTAGGWGPLSRPVPSRGSTWSHPRVLHDHFPLIIKMLSNFLMENQRNRKENKQTKKDTTCPTVAQLRDNLPWHFMYCLPAFKKWPYWE